MDKFVVRTRRGSRSELLKKRPKKHLKQATIESLQGVVVIEDILRMKSILKLEGQSKENILDALETLGKKIPPRNVLKSTKIGHIINKLSEHEDPEVSSQATRLLKEWQRVYQEKLDRPMIEVKSDHKTQKTRDSGRRLLEEALQIPGCRLAETIEREVFHQHKRILSSAYKRTMRNLVFTLRHQIDIRSKVVNREKEITEFVKEYRKEGKISDFMKGGKKTDKRT